MALTQSFHIHQRPGIRLTMNRTAEFSERDNTKSMLAAGYSCTPDETHAGLSEPRIACTTTLQNGPHHPSSFFFTSHLSRPTVNGLASKVVSPVESTENHRT